MGRLAPLAAVLGLLVLAPAAPAADQLLLVHGYGDADTGKDCDRSTFKRALDYFEDEGGRSRASMSTVGYYVGDEYCNVTIGDGQATNDRPIQDIARDLARYIRGAHTDHGESVDIVAHSMGGLITRVALLGSAQGWLGSPGKLDVGNVVTLSTPHQGVIRDPDHDDTEQWRQMQPGSGFLERLHADGSGIEDAWADGTDWTFLGSAEDETVTYASGIDKGRYADQKLGYRSNLHDAGVVDHEAVRTVTGPHRFDLSYWHASGEHGAHHTLRGWAPLKAAFKAATVDGDDLPR
jgi:pimeloyl-ACP methyl ester carboxylesterase